MGKDNTGYNVPFELAFEIIAAIIVEETAMPILPIINAVINRRMLLITKESNRSEYSIVITMFIKKTKTTLNSNLPENIVEGGASN